MQLMTIASASPASASITGSISATAMASSLKVSMDGGPAVKLTKRTVVASSLTVAR